MPIAVLTVMKLGLLLLLYIFVGRAVRAVVADVRGPRRGTAGPAPRPATATASSSAGKRARKPPKQLVLHPPEGRPTVVTLVDDPVTIGRSESCAVPIDDQFLSEEHAVITPSDDGGWTVRDLGSTNGTYLNGAKVTKPTPLAAGDQLRIGKTRLEVRR